MNTLLNVSGRRHPILKVIAAPSALIRSKSLNYQKVLSDVARTMVRLRKPERLVKLVTRLIDREVSVTHTSLLVFEESKQRFIFIDSKGDKKIPLGLIKVDANHPLIFWFQNRMRRKYFKHDHIYLPDLKRQMTALAHKPNTETVIQLMNQVMKAMQMMKADLVIPSYFKGNLLGLLLLGEKVSRRCFTAEEIGFVQVLAQDCSMAIKTAEFHQCLLRQNAELEKQIRETKRLRQKEHDTYYEVLRTLGQQIYAKDPYTYGHIHQVERLGMMTAESMGYDLTGRKKDILSASLILHDVGKIAIPDKILNKPAKLDPDEWEIMKTHAQRGAKMLEHLTDFKEVAEIIRCHHEKFDGSGYPRGIKGQAIPVESRIIAVVDAFHAIVSTRCYSKGRPVEVAMEELRRCGGAHFDSEVVEAFIRALKENMIKRGVGFFLEEESLSRSSH